ncbi:hypothetical protein OAL88_00330 [bacterium]|nr:hypothetical protein [bacterium]
MTRILTIIALLFVTPAAAFEVRATCKSESGHSEYFINLSSAGGTLEYRFMGQNVVYKVEQVMRDEADIYALAEFDSATSGETRGEPFMFKYDLEENVLSEINLLANCEAN